MSQLNQAETRKFSGLKNAVYYLPCRPLQKPKYEKIDIAISLSIRGGALLLQNFKKSVGE